MEKKRKTKQILGAALGYRRWVVWHRSVALRRLVRGYPIEDAELRRQVEKAASSVSLNIAEGAGLGDGGRKRHFKIALGSVGEVAASYELADAIGESVPVEQVVGAASEVAAMLRAVIRR